MNKKETIKEIEKLINNGIVLKTTTVNLPRKSVEALETAIEALQERTEGRLVEFPYHAYCIMDGKIYKGWVQKVEYAVARKPIFEVRYDDKSLEYHRGYVGLTVFLTQEEAEKALADMRESD